MDEDGNLRSESDEEGFTPPYPAFSTFNSFLANLNPETLPPRIDRSLMVGMANGVQTQILNSLREFGMIDEANGVTPLFLRATEDEDTRKAIYRDLITTYYAPQMALSEARGTAAQLIESFRPYGYQGSTLRKAITFFLSMASTADVQVSPYFKAPTQRAGSTPKRRPPTRAAEPEPSNAPAPTVAHRNAVRCDLPSGGSLTLVCEVDFVHLSREDREFMYRLIDDLQTYVPAAPAPEAD